MKVDMDNLRFFERISKSIHYALWIKYGVECLDPRFSFEGYPTCEIVFDDVVIGNSVVRVVLNPEKNLIVVSATYKKTRFFYKKSELTLALYGVEKGRQLASEIFAEFEKIKQE